jgi:hypothetical protein
MASTIPPILVQLQADISGLKKGLADAEKAIKGVDSNVKTASTGVNNFTNSIKKLGVIAGATFGTAQIVNFFRSSVAESTKAEAAQARLANLLMNTNGATQAQITALGQQARALEKVGVVSADNITVAQSQLATFDLTAASIATLTPAILNYVTAEKGAAATTDEFKQMTNGLAQAMQGNFASLTKTGFVLDAATKATIANGTEMERSRAVVEVLNSTYKDFNENLRKTSQGAMQVAINDFNNLKQKVGSELVPVISQFVGTLTSRVIPALTKLVDFLVKNKDSIIAVTKVLIAGAAAYATYRTAMIVASATTAAFRVVMVLMRGAQLASIASTNGLAASILVMNAAMRANPIGVIITALTLVAAGFVVAWKNSETFRKVVVKGVQIVINAFGYLLGYWSSALKLLGKVPGMGWAKEASEKLSDAANSVRKFSDGLDRLGTKKVEVEAKVKTTVDGKNVRTGDEIKISDKEAKARAKAAQEAEQARTRAITSYLETQISAHKNYQEKVKDLQKDYSDALIEAETRAVEQRADANEKYAEAVVDAQKSHTKVMVDIAKDYAKKIADIETAHQKKLTDIRAASAEKAADLRKSAAEKEVSIIQQSVDRLRSAFASGTGFSLTEVFKGKTSGGLLAQMKKQLDDAKKLQEAAAYLAGEGYAQTFIEQVVKAGPEVGLQMVDELKKSSPEQQAEIQSTFMDLEAIQETGLDTLAKSMNNGANLATAELRDAYNQVAIDLKASLADVDRQLQESLAVANAEYAMSMAEAKIERDNRMLEAATQLQEAIASAKATLDKALADAEATLAKARAEAQKRLNEGLAEAQRVLQKALIDAQLEYQKAIDDIASSTAAKLKALQAQLAAVAAATAALQTANANYTTAANVTPYVIPIPNATNTGPGTSNAPVTNIYTSVSGVNLTNPSSTANQIVSSIKYGTAVTVAKGMGHPSNPNVTKSPLKSLSSTLGFK